VRLARTVERLGLEYVVITSVNRDDLPDGGASVFAACIRAIRYRVPKCQVEVLTPDFQGNWQAVESVVNAGPAVFNHNIETVPRLYRTVRPGAKYGRSLELLRRVRELTPETPTKSGLMAGFGETIWELAQTMCDLRKHGCQLLTVGQYLQPDAQHLPVERYLHPSEFDTLREIGLQLGFRHVEAGPFVRSSYKAARQAAAAVAVPGS
jgi:lipoic acid synthetase